VEGLGGRLDAMGQAIYIGVFEVGMSGVNRFILRRCSCSRVAE
jgi:hypothetical protein